MPFRKTNVNGKYAGTRNRVTSGYERKLIVSFVFNLVQNLGHPGKQSNRTQLYKMFFDWSKFYASIVSTTRMMAALNEQQVFAERFILEGHNVVLTGQAGTGKTFLLKDIVSTLKFIEKKCSLLCTTGIGCMQYFDMGAETVHR